MERNYMSPGALVEYEFLQEQRAQSHYHENPELLFVLEGELHVTAEEQEYDLRSEDFILINANRSHGYSADRDFLAVRFQISAQKVREFLHQNTLLFWCGSVLEQNAACEEVRRILKEILLCSVNEGQRDGFYLKSLQYQLLSQLCGNYLLDENRMSEGQDKEKGRMDLILGYIREHYRNPISLQEVADEMYLSPTYLSKYVRKNSGKGFVELINSVRLSHATEDLLYTEDSVTKIALNNGFPSVAALNKAFRETYETTPSEFRKEKRKGSYTRNAKENEEENLKKTAIYLHQHYGVKTSSRFSQEVSLTLPLAQKQKMNLAHLLNVGTAEDLSLATAQRQILYCKEHLGVQYVRFWNIFEPGMYLDKASRQAEKLHFGKLDEILDFLVANGLKPYMELRSRNVRLLGEAGQVLAQQTRERGEDFADAQERRDFFDEFFRHLRRRFGPDEVSGWLFDYPLQSDMELQGDKLQYVPLTQEAWDEYLEAFEQISTSLRRSFPSGQIGGAGFPVQHYGEEKLTRLFERWRAKSVLPDFISVTSFPYQIVEEGERWYERRRTDLHFVRDDVTAVRRAMEAAGMQRTPLHLTECNLTLSDRNYLNDSVARAAFIANTVVGVFSQIQFLGIWNTRDAYSEMADSASYLFGGSGILTKTGAPKPAFHVLSFLKRLYTGSAGAEAGCLVTSNTRGHYKILAQHMVGMNTAYYLKEESQVSALEIDQMAASQERRTIHVRLEGLEESGWQIRRYSLSRLNGSILNEWLDMDMEVELRAEELRYLERVSTPHLSIQILRAKKGVLEFDIELEPNEVQYLHITEFN